MGHAAAKAPSNRSGESRRQCLRHISGRRRRLRGGPGQGAEEGQFFIPARRGGPAGRPGVAPPSASGPGLRRPGDRPCPTAGKSDPVRDGVLRHQLLQAAHLGGT